MIWSRLLTHTKLTMTSFARHPRHLQLPTTLLLSPSFSFGSQVAPQSKAETYITRKTTLKILKNKGIQELFPIQYQTYHSIYKGEDIIARDKTGSGKTLAFTLPVIERMRDKKEFGKTKLPKFLIILPTRELTLQVWQQITSLVNSKKPDFRAVAVYGQAPIHRQIEDINEGVDIIVGTPGRLVDLIDRGVIRMKQIRALCLDQADEMLKFGFKNEIERIYESITEHAKKKPQNMLFSATLPEWLKEISTKYLKEDCKEVDLIKDGDLKTPDTLKQMAVRLQASDKQRKYHIVSELIKKFAVKTGHSLIFCQTKKEVEVITGKLVELGVDAAALSSDVHQQQREVVYRNYKNGSLKCLVATDVAARGLDFPDIDVVIQTEPPSQLQQYIHRSGRTARKGKEGINITLYTLATASQIRSIEKQVKVSMERLKRSDFISNLPQVYFDQAFQEKPSQASAVKKEENVSYILMKNVPVQMNALNFKKWIEKAIDIRVRKLTIKATKDGICMCFIKFFTQSDFKKCLELRAQQYEGKKLSFIPQKPA